MRGIIGLAGLLGFARVEGLWRTIEAGGSAADIAEARDAADAAVKFIRRFVHGDAADDAHTGFGAYLCTSKRLRGLCDQARLWKAASNALFRALKDLEPLQIGPFQGFCAAETGFQFEIQDTGIGFDQTSIEDLFSPFSQADGSMTRRAGGAGPGVSLARDLSRVMGDIAGRGVDDEERPVRVLLADDHAANRKVIEIMLTALDVDIVVVENGEEAVKAYKSQHFDAVLMDRRCPLWTVSLR